MYVNDRELSRRTGIARVTWQSWRRDGLGPAFHRAGRRVLYKWATVAAWIESGAAQTLGGKAGAK